MTGTPVTQPAQAFIDLMNEHQIDPRVIRAFCRMYDAYRGGQTGKIPWAEIQQPEAEHIVDYDLISTEALHQRGLQHLGELVVIHLNGGLGTTMNLDHAKSLIPVREGQSFLALAARQILALREQVQVPIPWLLMNTPHIQHDCLAALADLPVRVGDLPLDFLQNVVPRIQQDTQQPVAFPQVEECWAPPGHGDIYLSLQIKGLLELLLTHGFRWAFVSNIDNLGATVDPCILGYLDEQKVQFAMEVTPKTLADIKGGTLVGRGGRLMLLEVAQVEEAHLQDFQDISVFSVFNSNNVWWRLDAVLDKLNQGALDLPLIVNPKRIHGQEVVQLETAMGAAVGCFERARGIRIPRRRFAPVKATCDLLAVRSDAYLLDDQGVLRPNPQRDPRSGPPLVTLDPRYYQGLDGFEARFPHPLSLLRCRKLVVEGDVFFGRAIRIAGEVVIRNSGSAPRHLPDGTALASGIYEL